LAYLALLLYTGLLFVRPQEWYPPLQDVHLIDFVVGFAVLAWMGHMIQSGWRPGHAPQNWLMLGLLGGVMMSHVSHTYLGALIESSREFGKVVLFYFLVSSLVTSVRRARGLLVVMGAGCLFMSINGILQAHTGVGFYGSPPQFAGGVVRVQAWGIFNDPNDLALMLVAVLPFLFNEALNRSLTAPWRIVSAATTVPLVYCIFLTNSRGGWVALCVMVLAYALIWLNNKKLALIVGACLVPLLLVAGPSRLQTMGADEDSAHGRIVAWGQGNAMLKSNPVFGVGMGRFGEFTEEGKVAHNSFVQCWAELGLFGYFFWLGMVIATLKDGSALGRLARDDPESEQISRLGKASTAALVGFLAAAFFLTRTFTLPLFLLLAFVAALRSVREAEDKPLPGGFALGDWKFIVFAEVASIVGIYVLIRILNLL